MTKELSGYPSIDKPSEYRCFAILWLH